MPVPKMLSPDIILKYPDIKYKPWLEYLEGDKYMSGNLHDVSRPLKTFINRQKPVNDKLLRLDSLIKKDNVGLTNTPIVTTEYNNLVFQKDWQRILARNYTLSLSYNDIKRKQIHTVVPYPSTQIISSVYKDFYHDIDIDHLLNDYNSFSTIFIPRDEILYINDVLLDYMKQDKNKKFDLLTLILYSRHLQDVFDEETVDVKLLHNFTSTHNGNPVKYTDEFISIINWFEDAIVPESFELKHIPDKKMLTKVDEQYKNMGSIYYVYLNVPYEIYHNCVARKIQQIYYNIDLECFFSEDKNQTALNVLAYDIAKNGFKKPIIMKLHEEYWLTPESAPRLLIADYFKLETIPCMIYYDAVHPSKIYNGDSEKGTTGNMYKMLKEYLSPYFNIQSTNE